MKRWLLPPFFLFHDIYIEMLIEMKRVVIKESQYNILNEGLSSILYHFTSISKGLSICSDDKIYLQSAFSKDADNYDRKRKFYLSCTRIKSSDFGYSYKFSRGGVRITLDGDLLANNFKGKQINYWNGMNDKFKYYEYFPERAKDINKSMEWEISRFKKNNPNATPEDIQHFIDYNFNDSAQHHTDNESEDRILSYEPVINEAHRFIKSIDVLLPNLFENEKDMETAAAFRFSTPTQISKLVRIFSSVEEFNSLDGKDCNDKIEYSQSKVLSLDRNFSRGVYYAIESVIGFISFANPEFDGKKFGSSVMKLFNKYGLEKYKTYIGKIEDKRNRGWGWGFDGLVEQLNASRRELSDYPNEDNSKILKMLTDYILSIGANSFREAYVKKKEMVDEHYGGNEDLWKKIDTNVKYNFYVFRYGVISLYPEKDLFKDAMSWNDTETKDWAEAVASIVMYEDGYNTSRSKNYNSMFQYIYKLFRNGTVYQVMDAFKKLGFTDEYLRDEWNIRIKSLDYWEAGRNNTVNSQKLSDENYKLSCKIRDKEIGKYFLEKQKVSKN